MGRLPLLAVLTLVAAVPATSQQVVRVSDRPSCLPCRITLRKVATLGSSEDPASPSGWVSLARDSRGRFYVAPAPGGGGVLLYDSHGDFLRVLGRRGGGPGEYRVAQEVRVGPGDSVLVTDPGQRRLTILSPNHRVVRTIPLPPNATGVLPAPDGGVTVQAQDRSADRAGLPLHRLSAAGRVLASFGAEHPTSRRDRAYEDVRAVNAGAGNAVWSARLNRYRVERWDHSGRMRLALERSPSWFEPWDQPPSGREDQVRPAPIMQAIREDARGLLWVFLRVPDTRWRPAARPARRDPGRERGVVPVGRLPRYLDTVIEVLDPRTGRLVASTRLEGVFAAFLVSGGNLVYGRREAADGTERIEVWEAVLTGYPGR